MREALQSGVMDITTFAIAVAAIVISLFAYWASHRSAKASERSADAAEASLELQRQEAQPKVQLEIRRYAPSIHALRNLGDATARNLTLHADDAQYVNWEDGLPLGDLQGRDVRTFVFAVGSLPTRLRFTWDGQDEPVPVELRG